MKTKAMKPECISSLATTGFLALALLVGVTADGIPNTPDHLLYDVESFTPITLGVPTDPLSIMQNETMMFTFDAAAGSEAQADAGGGVPMSVHCSISHTSTSSRTDGDESPEHLNMQLYSAYDSWFFRQSSVVPGVDKDLNLVVYPGYTTMVVELTGETDVLEEESGVVLFCEASPLTRLSFNSPSETFDFAGDMHRKMFLLDTSLIHDDISNHDHDEEEHETSLLAITCIVKGNTGTSSLMVYELHDDNSFVQIGSSYNTANTERFSFGLSLSAKMMTVIVTNVASERGIISNLHNELTCQTNFELVDGHMMAGSIVMENESSSAVSYRSSFSTGTVQVVALSILPVAFLLF